MKQHDRILNERVSRKARLAGMQQKAAHYLNHLPTTDEFVLEGLLYQVLTHPSSDELCNLIRSQTKEEWPISNPNWVWPLCPLGVTTEGVLAAYCPMPHFQSLHLSLREKVLIKSPKHSAPFPQAAAVNTLKLLSASQISEMFDTKAYVFWQLCLIHILRENWNSTRCEKD